MVNVIADHKFDGGDIDNGDGDDDPDPQPLHLQQEQNRHALFILVREDRHERVDHFGSGTASL